MLVAQLHDLLMPCCVESLCMHSTEKTKNKTKRALNEFQMVNEITMPSLEN